MALTHLRWEKSGRTLENELGQLVYESHCGQENVDLGGNEYAPYVWDAQNQTARYADHEVEFHDTYQVIKDYATSDVIAGDQSFGVERWQAGSWQSVSLPQRELAVQEEDDTCIVTRRYYDGAGTELEVRFTFYPWRMVKLTLVLTVANAGKYRIRFQNSGLVGIPTTRRYIVDGQDIGARAIVFDNIYFSWSPDEIGIHSNVLVEMEGGKRKLTVFLGEFDLEDNETITISPTTWGPTETSDDCMDYNGTYYDDSAGYLQIGEATGYMHCGWIWGSVTAHNTALDGCKITVDSYSTLGSGAIAELKAVNDDTPDAWQAGTIPSTVTKHDGAVTWNEARTGIIDSPEIKTIIQERFDGSHGPGEDMALVWMATGGSTDIIYIDAESGEGTPAKLTIVYQAATYEQEGFRFRDDDADEDEAAWLANQDVDISRAKNTNTRLRILTDVTDDAASEAATLQYKKSGDSDDEYRAIPVS